jgi:hypothetical protein
MILITVLLVALMLTFTQVTALNVALPLVRSIDNYVGNIFVYYTWSTSFVLCAFWGALNIVFTADRGLAYSTCISNFQTVFTMDGGYIN